MIPHTDKALLDLAMKLALEIAPETSTDYAAANTSLIAVLLQLFAQECERGVEIRWRDIQALKQLFSATTVELDGASELKAELQNFVNQEPASLILSELDRVHAKGLSLLIRLQAYLEGPLETGETTGETSRKIWQFLEDYTNRHSFEVLM